MPLKTSEDSQPALNMTPMIDIVFLLIIFFMVGTRFSELNDTEKRLELNLPPVADGAPMSDAPRRRIVHILQDGTIHFKGQQVTKKKLLADLVQLKKNYPKQGIIIRGDADSRHKSLVAVLEACQKAEIVDLSITGRITVANRSGLPVAR